MIPIEHSSPRISGGRLQALLLRVGTHVTRAPGRRHRCGALLRRAVAAMSLLILAARGAAAAAAAAPDSLDLTVLSLEQLAALPVQSVEAASGHSQRLEEAPASVTIVTGEEIRRLGYRTLAEALNGVVGLYARDDYNFSYLGLRGFGRPGNYNTHILLQVDGHRINDNVSARPALGTDLGVPLDEIDRVEVVRGPSSSLYGSNAFLGVINVITRRPDAHRDLHVHVAGGSPARGLAEVAGNTPVAGGFLRVTGTLEGGPGHERLYFPEFAATNGGVARDADRETTGRAWGNWQRGPVHVDASWMRRVKHIPTASFNTVFGDDRTRTDDRRFFVHAAWEDSVAPAWDLRARLAWDATRTGGTYVYDYADSGAAPELVQNVDRFTGRALTGEFQARHAPAPGHEITVGTEVIANLCADQKNSDIDPPAVYLDDERRGLDIGVYAQDEVRLVPRLRLNAGLRWDHSFQSGEALSPRAALLWTPRDPTTLKFLFGRAFRAPSPNESYYSDGGISQVPNPTLKPEHIRTFELALEHRLGEHVRATLSGYHFRITDLIEEGNPEPGLIQLENLGRVRARGLEAELQGRTTGGLSFRASAALTDAVDDLTGERLVNSPRRLGRLNVIAPVADDRAWLGVELVRTGGVRTLADRELAGFTLAHVTLSGNLPGNHLEAAFTLRNAFDTPYRIVGGPELVQDSLPGERRAWRLTLTARY